MTPDQMNAQMFAALSQIQRDVAFIRESIAKGGAPASGGPARGASQNSGASNGPAEGAVAEDRDLDGERGDVTIRFDPKERYWTGNSYAGYRFSECPPEYLDAMAKSLDASAWGQENSIPNVEADPKKSPAEKSAEIEKMRKGARYKRLDAARARGWAKRIRERGGHVPPQAQNQGGGGYGGSAGYDASSDVGAGNNGPDSDIPF